jgi:uncharacterized membrane protein
MKYLEIPPVELAQPGGEGRVEPTGPPASATLPASVAASVSARPKRRKRGPGIAVGLLALVVAIAVIPVWIHFFLTYDPADSRLSPAKYPLFYPVLVLHVFSSTLALVTCVLQIWPWLRSRHRRVHRYVGRVYVLVGVFPAGVTAVLITVFWPFSAVTAVEQAFAAVLWVSITAYGFHLGRQGRFADHRRWMLRSFALTASVLLNEILLPPVELLLRTQLDTRLAGSQDVLTQVVNATDNWLGLTISFIAVEFYLEREQLRRSARRRSVAAGKSGESAAEARESAAEAAVGNVSAS